MNSKMTETKSHSARFSHRFMNHRGIIYAVVSVWLGVMLGGPVPDASALPTADEVMQELHLSDIDREPFGRLGRKLAAQQIGIEPVEFDSSDVIEQHADGVGRSRRAAIELRGVKALEVSKQS